MSQPTKSRARLFRDENWEQSEFAVTNRGCWLSPKADHFSKGQVPNLHDAVIWCYLSSSEKWKNCQVWPASLNMFFFWFLKGSADALVPRSQASWWIPQCRTPSLAHCTTSRLVAEIRARFWMSSGCSRPGRGVTMGQNHDPWQLVRLGCAGRTLDCGRFLFSFG